MADPDHPATMTVEQAGALLGISRSTAYRAAAAGHIPNHPTRSPHPRPHRHPAPQLGIEPRQGADSDGSPNRSGFEQTGP